MGEARDVKNFNSLADFATHLVMLETAEVVALHKGIDHVAVLIEKTAKSEIGNYQNAVGPFSEWAELADSTEAEKARKGYPSDAPLLRTGDLRESITHETEGLRAIIGSTSKIMEYQEFGTSRIPPRPVIGPAAFRNQEAIQEIVGSAAVTGLIGGDLIHPSLGYDMDITTKK